MSAPARRKILFYCQSLVGLGHLTSSLRVIGELSEHADVDLIYGGQTVPAMPEYPGFRHLRLPTILIDSASEALYVPDGKVPLETRWIERRAAMEAFLAWPYDALVVEFFPFGRRRLKREILGLFRLLRERSGPVPIFSFVREILVPVPREAEQRMVELVREHIHTVFVRGDPAIVRFEETFSLTEAIAGRLFYAGYVSPPSPTDWPQRRKQILVSQGGGEIGRSLLQAAIRAAGGLPDYRFLVVASSRATEVELGELRDLVTSDNVEVVRFLRDFQEQMLHSALSVSLGGDNTLMDVISTSTPALAFPYPGNSEQGLRIAKLAERGFVAGLGAEDLQPDRLRARIAEALGRPYPERPIDHDGARRISERIAEILAADIPAAPL